MPESFIGAGWAFPLGTDTTGSVALSSGERKIVESIRLILGTARGERPMRPGFGCRIHERMFDVVDINTVGTIQADVMDALAFWEPRITVRDVTVSLDDNESGKIYVDVMYALRGSNDRRNLVFPFYVIPDREE